MTDIANQPPHNLDIELSILSTCFIAGGEVLAEIIDLVSAEYFYRKSHKIIFGAILDVSHDAESVDLATVVETLRDSGKLDVVGGAVALSKIIDNPVAVDIPYSCKRLEEKFLLRKAIEKCYSTIKQCHNEHGEFDEIVTRYVEYAHEVSEGSKAGDPVVSLKEISIEASDIYEQRYREKKIVTGVPSGINDLDMKTFGLHAGDLTILAGRPAMGKTAIALNIAKNAAEKGYGSLIMSLEMPKTQLFDRLVAMETGINGMNIRIGNFTKKEFEMVNDATGRLYDLPIFIDDRGGLQFTELVKTVRRTVKSNPEIKLLIIDHLQLLIGNNPSNRNLEVGTFSAGLKTLSKELRIPVLALSQLNRELERRNNPYRRPRLSDLRDSGSLEQDADNVIFIYRPWEYGDNISPVDGQSEVQISETDCELIVAKQRQGTTGTVNCQFYADSQRVIGESIQSPDELYRQQLKKRENANDQE
jgi:replicative DNA helicase